MKKNEMVKENIDKDIKKEVIKPDGTPIKRIIAYLIDFLIISILFSLLSQINFLNPFKDKLNEISKDLTEYTEMVSNMNTYVVDEIYTEEYYELIYDAAYYGTFNTLILVVVVALYFTLFPFFFNNQTIGMRLTNLHYKYKNNKLRFIYLFLRSLLVPFFDSIIIYCNLTNILMLVMLLIFKDAEIFANAYSILAVFLCSFGYINIVVLLYRKDHRSLIDIITKTEVELIKK